MKLKKRPVKKCCNAIDKAWKLNMIDFKVFSSADGKSSIIIAKWNEIPSSLFNDKNNPRIAYKCPFCNKGFRK